MKCSKCGTEFEGNFCPKCATPAQASVQTPPVMPNGSQAVNAQQAKPKKPVYKKWWFWLIIAVAVLIIIAAVSGNSNSNSGTPKQIETVVVYETEENSNTEVNTEKVIEKTEKQTEAATKPLTTQPTTQKISMEYRNALKKAETYSNMMHMSKKGIYDQLVSEYGEGFSEDAAQYAVDNLKADYKANALAKAKTYQQTMNMSKSAIYDQLVSDYGEKFTASEAQYAVDNLED